MDKRPANRPKSRGLNNLQLAGEDLQNTVKDKTIVFSTKNDIRFHASLTKENHLYIKALVFHLINLKESSFNESMIVREGIQLMREAYPEVKQRPDTIPAPLTRGRGKKTEEEIGATSFTLNEADIEFIKNFAFHELKKGYKFNKIDFFQILVEELKKKYGKNIK